MNKERRSGDQKCLFHIAKVKVENNVMGAHGNKVQTSSFKELFTRGPRGRKQSVCCCISRVEPQFSEIIGLGEGYPTFFEGGHN